MGGVVVRKPHAPIPAPGEAIELLGRRSGALDCGSGWQIHPRVALLFLDRALAVVNKGVGLISVPAPNAELSALSILADFLAGRLKARDRGVAGKTLPALFRSLQPQPVHRLDQYTTGVFCMALSVASRAHLIQQLATHTMRREYVAYAEGRAPAPQGTWRNWLELSRDEMRQRVLDVDGQEHPSAKEAITHYEVLAEYPVAGEKAFFTKLRLRLETGRKHQIRAQAAHAGLPLIGDRVYNANYRERHGFSPVIPFPRQALHALKLTLEHPELGKVMSWDAPLPKDLRQLESNLGFAANRTRHVDPQKEAPEKGP